MKINYNHLVLEVVMSRCKHFERSWYTEIDFNSTVPLFLTPATSISGGCQAQVYLGASLGCGLSKLPRLRNPSQTNQSELLQGTALKDGKN